MRVAGTGGNACGLFTCAQASRGPSLTRAGARQAAYASYRAGKYGQEAPSAVRFGLPAASRVRDRLALRMGSDDPWEIKEELQESTGGRKRVAIVGSGAVGLYYGARLLEAGHDVTFLARSELSSLKEHGLTVESIDGDMHFDSVKAVASTEEIGEVDWVLMCLKTHGLESAPALLKPLMGKDTRLLAIMNGFGIEEKLAEVVPEDKIFGGMAFVASYREDHVVKHIKFGPILGGHMHDDAAELDELKNLFYGSKVKVMASDNLRMARWEKLCWNVPFNGMAVAMGGIPVDKIVQDPDMRALAHKLMNEVITAANMDADSLGIAPEFKLDREDIVQRMFALTDTMGDYKPSTMVDLVEGRKMEVEYLFEKPLQCAHQLPGDFPHMESLVTMVTAQARLKGLGSDTATPLPFTVESSVPLPAKQAKKPPAPPSKAGGSPGASKAADVSMLKVKSAKLKKAAEKRPMKE